MFEVLFRLQNRWSDKGVGVSIPGYRYKCRRLLHPDGTENMTVDSTESQVPTGTPFRVHEDEEPAKETEKYQPEREKENQQAYVQARTQRTYQEGG